MAEEGSNGKAAGGNGFSSPDGREINDHPYIDFQHVSKAFGSNRVLDDVSFQVMPGETLCILGAAASASRYLSRRSWDF